MNSTKFWQTVQRGEDGDCWPWLGSTGAGDGKIRYGKLWDSGKKVHVYAHRYAFEQTHGEIPTSLVVRHHCDNPVCCNPAHLAVGTQQDNVKDRQKRNRHRSLRGEETHKAKLTEKIVQEIKRRLAKGESAKRLAQEYGVVRTAISEIKRGANWAWVITDTTKSDVAI